jgi:hypothetical protein
MLDFLKTIFKKEFQLTNISFITGRLADIMLLLEQEYVQDKDAKNAAIDAIIKILEDHKDKPPTT